MATPREAIGAAMHTLGVTFEERRDELADPDAVARQIAAVREELCAETPQRLLLSAYVDELAAQVRADEELSAAVDRLRHRIADWLG